MNNLFLKGLLLTSFVFDFSATAATVVELQHNGNDCFGGGVRYRQMAVKETDSTKKAQDNQKAGAWYLKAGDAYSSLAQLETDPVKQSDASLMATAAYAESTVCFQEARDQTNESTASQKWNNAIVQFASSDASLQDGLSNSAYNTALSGTGSAGLLQSVANFQNAGDFASRAGIDLIQGMSASTLSSMDYTSLDERDRLNVNWDKFNALKKGFQGFCNSADQRFHQSLETAFMAQRFDLVSKQMDKIMVLESRRDYISTAEASVPQLDDLKQAYLYYIPLIDYANKTMLNPPFIGNDDKVLLGYPRMTPYYYASQLEDMFYFYNNNFYFIKWHTKADFDNYSSYLQNLIKQSGKPIPDWLITQ